MTRDDSAHLQMGCGVDYTLVMAQAEGSAEARTADRGGDEVVREVGVRGDDDGGDRGGGGGDRADPLPALRFEAGVVRGDRAKRERADAAALGGDPRTGSGTRRSRSGGSRGSSRSTCGIFRTRIT